jgi:CubicO group peptidase (beta-lactamase class C family)
MKADAWVPDAAELKDVIASVARETGVPGIGLALSVCGQQVAAYAGSAVEGGDYPLSEHSRFEMSCLMKLFISLVALELDWEGKLDLDEPVQQCFPTLFASVSGNEPIRIRHLQTHTSGYHGLDISDQRVRWNCSWEGFEKHCQQRGQSFPAGAVFNYEHSEHVLLGEIIHRTCGQSALTLVKERILEPLGIILSNSRADQKEGRSYVAQHAFVPQTGRCKPLALPAFGSFWSNSLPDATITLPEVLSVGEALLSDEGLVGKNRVFSQETRMAAQRRGTALPDQISSGPRSEIVPYSFGLALGHYPDGLLGHNGSMSGQTCGLRIDPSRRIAVAVGVNAWAPYARDRAINAALSLVYRSAQVSQGAAGSMADHCFDFKQVSSGFSAAQLEGRYVGSYFGEILVSSRGNALDIELGAPGSRRGRFSLVADSSGLYRIDSAMPVRIGFFADPAQNSTAALMLGVHAYKKAATGLST